MGKVTNTKVIEEGSLYKFYFIQFQYLYMNLREKGGSNLLVQRRNRREQSRFRPSRSCPLLSPPDRIRGKIQRIHRQSQGGGKLSLPSRHPPSIPFIHGSARASGNCLSQLPNPFTPSSMLDFGQLRVARRGAAVAVRHAVDRGWAWQRLPLSPFLGMTRS